MLKDVQRGSKDLWWGNLDSRTFSWEPHIRSIVLSALNLNLYFEFEFEFLTLTKILSLNLKLNLNLSLSLNLNNRTRKEDALF